MKRNLGPPSLLTAGLLLLNSVPALSQQQVASVRTSDSTINEARKTGLATPEEYRAEISRLQSRKTALQKYISTVDPASNDFLVTSRSVREIDLRLKELDATLQTLSAAAARKLTLAENAYLGKYRAEVRLKIDPAYAGDVKLTVIDRLGSEVFSRTLTNLMRGVNDYTTIVDLTDGQNIVVASSPDEKELSNSLVLLGGAAQPAPEPAEPERAPAAIEPRRTRKSRRAAPPARVNETADAAAGVSEAAAPSVDVSAASGVAAPAPAAIDCPAGTDKKGEVEITSPAAGATTRLDKIEVQTKLTSLIKKLSMEVKNAAGAAKTASKEVSLNDVVTSSPFVIVPKDPLIAELSEGENLITVSDADKPAVKHCVKVTYTKLAAAAAPAAPAAPAKPAMPGINFVETGDRRVRLFNLDPGATVKLKVNGVEKVNQPATSAEAILSIDPVSAGDILDVTQTKNSLTSDSATFEVTQGPISHRTGGPFGLLVGGTVISQQAQELQQADPFFGFITGYTSKLRGKNKKVTIEKQVYELTEDGELIGSDNYLYEETPAGLQRMKDAQGKERWVSPRSPRLQSGFSSWRWNLRFQGIFQSDPRTATTTNATAAPANATNTSTGCAQGNANCFKFIASRKTFDIETHAWLDYWANNVFSIGPYAAIGASAALDKNELQGEPVTPPDTEASGDDTDQTTQVATNSQSANDLKKFYEFGVLSNIFLLSRERPLYVQSIVGYGNYEALNGLYEGFNTKHRFIGKLRVFPLGLRRGFGRQIQGAPMFGVDLNASRGPDHLKFFTGYAISIRGFDIPTSSSN